MRSKKTLHGGGFLVPHAGLLPTSASEFATFTPTLPPLRSAATAQPPRTEGRVVCRRLCRQHAKVKLDKASQFVPADVAHCIRFNSKVFAGTPQQALLKAYDEQNSREVLPPTWKNKRVSPLGINAPQYTLTSRKPREGLPVSI